MSEKGSFQAKSIKNATTVPAFYDTPYENSEQRPGTYNKWDEQENMTVQTAAKAKC